MLTHFYLNIHIPQVGDHCSVRVLPVYPCTLNIYNSLSFSLNLNEPSSSADYSACALISVFIDQKAHLSESVYTPPRAGGALLLWRISLVWRG